MAVNDVLRAHLRALLALGVKQQDLADRLDLHRNKLSRFLDGDPTVNIPITLIEPLHRYLDEIERTLTAARAAIPSRGAPMAGPSDAEMKRARKGNMTRLLSAKCAVSFSEGKAATRYDSKDTERAEVIKLDDWRLRK